MTEDRQRTYCELLGDLEAETVSLLRLLAGLGSEQWRADTPSTGWTVHDQVGHLAYFDEAAAVAVTAPDQFRRQREALLRRDPNVATAAVAELRTHSSSDVLARFGAARAALVSAYRGSDPRQRVPWYGPEMSAMSSATARVMESWVHGVDVAAVLRAPIEDTPRLRHIVELGVRTFAFSFRNRGAEPPGPLPRVELGLADGRTCVYGDGSSQDRIAGPAVDFVLVVAQRRHVSETGLLVAGPVASAWMEQAQIFAGPPTIYQRPPQARPPATVAAPPVRVDRPRRPDLGRITSLLFCPANRPDRVVKLPSTDVDVGVIDLEDAVAAAGKAEARQDLRTAGRDLGRLAPRFPYVVRVNKVGSEWFEDDIAALAGLAVAGVVLPKVETAADIEALVRCLHAVGQNDLPVIAGIETARGVVRLEQILAGARVHAVYFGAEDLSADLEATRTRDGLEVLYARSSVALHARVAGAVAIDQVVVQLDDDKLFRKDAAMGRSLGYQGKICLHPRQVPLAHEAFRPSPEGIAAARRLIAAYDAEAARGGGVIRLDGEMVDEPLVRRARHLVRWESKEQPYDGH